MNNQENNQEITWTWSTPGDGTEGGNLLDKIIKEVMEERAAEGYLNEQQYLNRRTEFEV